MAPAEPAGAQALLRSCAREVEMRKPALVSLALLIALAGALAARQEPAQEAPSELKIPPEEAKRENPVKAEAGSIAQGKRFYETQCQMCHGKDGDGKGDLADVMDLKLRDYRQAEALKDFTDGELRYILVKGKGKMPSQEGRMKPEQFWHMVNYIRSLAKKEPAPKPEEKKPQQ